MWHRAEFIAKTQQLDVASFVEFCRRDDIAVKFKLVMDAKMPICSTMHCDDLVNAFLVNDQLQPGTHVRSYDFQTNKDCFIEGTIVSLDTEQLRYCILVDRRVFNGAEISCEHLLVHPPFNGLPGIFGKTAHVEQVERHPSLLDRAKTAIKNVKNVKLI